ncbi:LOW QUALITY PROTEIN: zinc transporter 2-like [Stegastes partitus]|uniref:Probable proton-coupled zinc antiporter SLC30A3 n=1 Tax=Stegastes partitus TaxID=144197 RepID=A0A9Y4K7F9_9TELE|nr:PREDICTED: LOW QUALITY PROTEIN: zinc transporter 2-like [Stegastes partitus]
MEFSADSEKQRLIETHLEHLIWTSPPEEQYSDSEFSEETSSVDGLWQPEWFCQETTAMSENHTRSLARKKLYVACAVSLVFMTGEVIGGYAAHSLAIMTDAAHLLTDFGSIMISIFSLRISSRPQTQMMTFGWHRAGGIELQNKWFDSCVSLNFLVLLLISSLIFLQPEYKVADPICTFLFSVLVLATTFPVTRDVFRILMEGVPQDVSFSAVEELLLSVRGVVSVHSLHMWSLNMTQSLLSVHVTAEQDADSEIVLRKTTKLLCSEFGFSSVTIQVERCRNSAHSSEAVR